MSVFLRIRERLKDSSGETLLEVVVSIGLFALMMLMVASMFVVAGKTMVRNFETDARVDKAVSAIAEVKAGDTSDSNGNPVTTATVHVTFMASGTALKNPDRDVKLVSAEGLYKYTE